ncbi:hypothetical protein DMUE_0607 [Dictyocoela muelleri]|nr:hypothetical protein DMUE_0607 [Dictyocoela muelleri]
MKWHVEMGRLGILKTWKTLNSNKNIYTYLTIKTTLRECIPCQKNTISNMFFGETSEIVESNKPFKILATDIVEPFQNNDYKVNPKNKKFHILTICDIFSRHTTIYQLSNITSSELIIFLINILKFLKYQKNTIR